jgi:lysophospholipase L1-like esterase
MRLLVQAAKSLTAIVSVIVLVTGCAASSGSPGARAVAPPKELWVAVVGDSYTGGSDMGGVGGRGWPALAGAQLRDQGLVVTMQVNSEGGAGYAERGVNGGVFVDQLSALRPYTNVVVFLGSRNDDEEAPDVVAAAARDAYAKAKSLAPQAKLLAIGPFWPDMPVTPEALTQRDAVRDAAVAAGAVFVDPMTLHWLDQPGLIGADGVHPNDAGHQYLADQITPLLKNELVGI